MFTILVFLSYFAVFTIPRRRNSLKMISPFADASLGPFTSELHMICVMCDLTCETVLIFSKTRNLTIFPIIYILHLVRKLNKLLRIGLIFLDKGAKTLFHTLNFTLKIAVTAVNSSTNHNLLQMN